MTGKVKRIPVVSSDKDRFERRTSIVIALKRFKQLDHKITLLTTIIYQGCL